MTDSQNGDYADDVVCLDDADLKPHIVSANHDDEDAVAFIRQHLNHTPDDDDDQLNGLGALDGDDDDNDDEAEEDDAETTVGSSGLGLGPADKREIKLSDKATVYLGVLQAERMHIDQTKCPITERLLDEGECTRCANKL